MDNNTITDTNVVDYDIDAKVTAYLENLRGTTEKYNNQNAVYGKDNKNGTEKPYVTLLKSRIMEVNGKIRQVNQFIDDSQKECNEGKITAEENLKNRNAYLSLLADLNLDLKALETDLNLSILLQTEPKMKSDLVWTRAQLNDSHVTGDKRKQLEFDEAMLKDKLDKISFEKKSQILSFFKYSDDAHKSVIENREELNKNQYNNTQSSFVNLASKNVDSPFTDEEALDAYLETLGNTK